MALYIGNNVKQKLIMDGVVYRVNLSMPTPITNFIKLLSSDNYILKDSDGVYLTVKEDE